MKLLSLFSGIGAFERALSNLNIAYELVNYCEIDKFASKCYSILHNESEDKNLKDITKIDIDSLPAVDMVTYGFPCQDISIAGLQKGLVSGTRSSLVFNALKIIEHCKPKYAICENVKNLVGKKFKADFDKILSLLKEMGYNSYYKVLDAQNFGIPQHRERVFVISIRKDIDNHLFCFPAPIPLEQSLQDILLPNVNVKYYLTEQQKQRLKEKKFHSERDRIQNKSICNTLLSRDFKGPKCIRQIMCTPSKNCENTQFIRVYDLAGISPTLSTCSGGGMQPHIKLGDKIRKLTPEEYFILQGLTSSDVDRLRQSCISNSQLYKMAGNSICVPVLEAIFKNLFNVVEQTV